jgi:hypothetical protein
MTGQYKFHWAERVSRRDIQRLYESDAQGMLDTELLDEVHYAIYARVCDMFEVREAQQFGLIPEILRLAPELAVKPQDQKTRRTDP